MYVYARVLHLQILAQSPTCQGCEREPLLVFSWQSEGVQLAESKVHSFTSVGKEAGSKDLPLLSPGGRFQLWLYHWHHSCATAGLRPVPDLPQSGPDQDLPAGLPGSALHRSQHYGLAGALLDCV